MTPASVDTFEPDRNHRSKLWRARDPGAVSVREWDGDVVVYNANAASTHLLSPAAGVIFMVLLEAVRPMAVAELAAMVFDDAALPSPAPACTAHTARDGGDGGPGDEMGDDAGLSDLQTVLDDLDRIGLVEQVAA